MASRTGARDSQRRRDLSVDFGADREGTAREVTREALPFFGAAIAVLMLVTFVPGFSTWLPDLIGGR